MSNRKKRRIYIFVFLSHFTTNFSPIDPFDPFKVNGSHSIYIDSHIPVRQKIILLIFAKNGYFICWIVRQCNGMNKNEGKLKKIITFLIWNYCAKQKLRSIHRYFLMNFRRSFWLFLITYFPLSIFRGNILKYFGFFFFIFFKSIRLFWELRIHDIYNIICIYYYLV